MTGRPRVRLLPLLLAAVVVVAPIAAASTLKNVEYVVFQGADNGNGGAYAEAPFDVPKPPVRYEGSTTASHWRVSAYYESSPSLVGVDAVQFTLVVDGRAVEDCTWEVSRSGGEARRPHHYDVACVHNGTVAPGAHTLEIQAGVNAGSNPVGYSKVGVTLVQTEVENVGIMIGDVVWFLWAIFAVVLFTVKDPWLRVLFSLAGYLALLAPMDDVTRDVLVALQTVFVFALTVGTIVMRR